MKWSTPSRVHPHVIILNSMIEIVQANLHLNRHLTDHPIRCWRSLHFSILVCYPDSSTLLLSVASSSLRASSPINSGFSYRLEPGGSTSAFVDVPACAMSFFCCLRSRSTRKYSGIAASDTPTVTPTPIPAFVLELSPEVAIPWSV